MRIPSSILNISPLAILPGLLSLGGAAYGGLIAEWDFDAHNAQDSSELSTDYDLSTFGTGPAYDGGYAVFDGSAANYLDAPGPGAAGTFTASFWKRTIAFFTKHLA